MKKTLAIVIASVIFSLCSLVSNAQTYGLGAIGGFTSSNANVMNFDANAISVYHFGVTDKFNLGLGFAVQPSVVYQVKGTSLDAMVNDAKSGIRALDTQVGFLEIPVQLQWGPDLLAFRPYVFAEPFIGYGLNFKAESTLEKLENNWDVANIKRWEYGLGIGAGLEVWHLQISGRYFWNFGQLYGKDGSLTSSDVARVIESAFKEGKSFNGFSVSVALFFGRNDR